MADIQETIADIIAEKRRQADKIERDCAEKMKRGEMISDRYARELVADIRREADRIWAAHDHDIATATEASARAVVGACVKQQEAERDAAKVREALEKIAHYDDNDDGMDDPYCADGHICAGIARIALAALAAPATTEKSSAVGDAAHKRECGNSAALREALVKCREIALQWQADEAAGVAGTTDKPHSRSAAEAVVDMEFEINAALAAPPRNCDRFASAEEAWDAYDEWVNSYRAQGKTEPFNEFGWLFAPATEQEGGEK